MPEIKKFKNNPNKEYLYDDENNSVSRKIAEVKIYNKNSGLYQKPFGDYVVHHVNGETFDNSIKNLYICLPEQHNKIHEEQKRRREKFKSKEQIDAFFEELREKKIQEENEKNRKEEEKKRRDELDSKKIYSCESCGRKIADRGNCLSCNMSKQKEREKIIKQNQLKKKKIKKILIIFSVLALLVFSFQFIYKSNSYNVTDELYNRQQSEIQDWDSESSCKICWETFGKNNIEACGGIPKYDFTTCHVGNEIEGRYVDIFSHKEISQKDVDLRIEKWKEFLSSK